MATPLSFWYAPRGFLGFKRTVTQQAQGESSPQPFVGVIPAMALTNSDGGEIGTAGAPFTVAQASQTPTAGNNLSGTATTASGAFNIPANAARRPGDVQGQNVSGVSIGFNEFGGTAVIGSAGTYTVPAGATFSITTTAQVNFIAASGTANVTITALA